VSKMTPDLSDLRLPSLSEQELESLAEECETVITEYILTKIPAKSVEELVVSCIIDYTSQLDIEIVIDIDQKYDTGYDLDMLTKEASEQGFAYLEEKLTGLRAH
jgi:hypothetical protein